MREIVRAVEFEKPQVRLRLLPIIVVVASLLLLYVYCYYHSYAGCLLTALPVGCRTRAIVWCGATFAKIGLHKLVGGPEKHVEHMLEARAPG